jgi:predicted nucleic acid-binding protein
VTDLLFVDTSAWYAFVNRRDPEHAPARTLFEEFEGRLVTSNYVFDETVALCVQRLGHASAVRVGDVLLDADAVQLVRATPDDERDAWDLFRECTDKVYSFTDCISFAMMRRLGIARAAALDEDYRREGFEVLP